MTPQSRQLTPQASARRWQPRIGVVTPTFCESRKQRLIASTASSLTLRRRREGGGKSFSRSSRRSTGGWRSLVRPNHPGGYITSPGLNSGNPPLVSMGIAHLDTIAGKSWQRCGRCCASVKMLLPATRRRSSLTPRRRSSFYLGLRH